MNPGTSAAAAGGPVEAGSGTADRGAINRADRGGTIRAQAEVPIAGVPMGRADPVQTGAIAVTFGVPRPSGRLPCRFQSWKWS